MMVARHTRGRVRKPPREETAGGRASAASDAMDLTAVVPECEYNFCDMAELCEWERKRRSPPL